MMKTLAAVVLIVIFFNDVSYASSRCRDLLLFLGDQPEQSLGQQIRRGQMGLFSSMKGFTTFVLGLSHHLPESLKQKIAVAAEDLLFDNTHGTWSIRLGHAFQQVAETSHPPIVDDFTVIHSLVRICMDAGRCVLLSPGYEPRVTAHAGAATLNYNQVAQPIRRTLVGASLLARERVDFLEPLQQVLSKGASTEPFKDHIDTLAEFLGEHFTELKNEAPTWVDESGHPDHRGYWAPLDKFDGFAALYPSRREFQRDLALFLTLLKDREGLSRTVLKRFQGQVPTAKQIAFRFLAEWESTRATLYGTPKSEIWSRPGDDLTTEDQVHMTPENIRDVAVLTQFIQNYFPLENSVEGFPQIYEGLMLTSKSLGVYLAPVDQLKTLMDASKFLETGRNVIVRITWDPTGLTESPGLEKRKSELYLTTGLMLSGSTNVLETPLLFSPEMTNELQRLDAGQQIPESQVEVVPNSGVKSVRLPRNPKGAIESSFVVNSKEGLIRILGASGLPTTYRSYARGALMEDPKRPSSASAFQEELATKVRVEWAPADSARPSTRH